MRSLVESRDISPRQRAWHCKLVGMIHVTRHSAQNPLQKSSTMGILASANYESFASKMPLRISLGLD